MDCEQIDHNEKKLEKKSFSIFCESCIQMYCRLYKATPIGKVTLHSILWESSVFSEMYFWIYFFYKTQDYL